MAKKKKRYKKHKTKDAPKLDMRSLDNHHLCWPKRVWESGVARKLRAHPYCIVRVPKYTLHKQIHSNVSGVPVPKNINIEGALFQLELLERFGGISNNDPIEKRLMVLAAIFDCSEQPTSDAFKKQAEIVREFYNKPS